jgi:molybdopterin-dependent oxidoreductase alpha subunit
MNENLKEESPETLRELTVTKPLHIAAGMGAVISTLKQVYGKMGIVGGTQILKHLNQQGGVDCSSCAWSDPEERTLAEFCESGAKAMADEGTKQRADANFFAKYSVAELSEKSDYWLNSQGRISQPFILREGKDHYQPITWEDAFALIAAELNSLASPDEAIFYTSGRTANETAFLYQLFVRQFGTNNMPDCSNMCHESTSVALAESIGLGKATVRLEDFKKTDLIMIIGQNPGTNAPRMMSSLQEAKRAGAKMVTINPLPEAGLMGFVNPNPQHYPNPLKFPVELLGNIPTQFSDLHLPVRIGGDMAILKGIMKSLLEREKQAPGTVFDQEFIKEHTSGYEELIAGLDTVAWDEIETEGGISKTELENAAEMFVTAERIITCWAMGVTQHKHSVAIIQDIVNLHLLLGQIGKEGAGLCPVRGHSNVQGDRTMGVWHKMHDKFRENLEKEFNFQTPEKDGFDVVASIKAMHEGQAKFYFSMGGNLLSAVSDTEYATVAFQNCRLNVQVLTKLNRTAVAGGGRSLLLPCLGRSEIDMQQGGQQFVSTESTMLHVVRSQGILKPASEHLRSEPWIVAKMAQAVLGDRSTVDWDDLIENYDNIRDAISRVVPGHENYNAKVRQSNGFFLPSKPRQKQFPTASGKAVFTFNPLPEFEIAEGRLLLTSIRSHDQFNTTIYGFGDRYRGIHGSRRVILMNPTDIKARVFQAGQVVDITSHYGDETRTAKSFIVVPYPIPKGCVATYFPEANPLVPIDSKAEKSHTPTSKSIIVSLQKTGEIMGNFEYNFMEEA